jgi:hypothetical protein
MPITFAFSRAPEQAGHALTSSADPLKAPCSRYDRACAPPNKLLVCVLTENPASLPPLHRPAQSARDPKIPIARAQ